MELLSFKTRICLVVLVAVLPFLILQSFTADDESTTISTGERRLVFLRKYSFCKSKGDNQYDTVEVGSIRAIFFRIFGRRMGYVRGKCSDLCANLCEHEPCFADFLSPSGNDCICATNLLKDDCAEHAECVNDSCQCLPDYSGEEPRQECTLRVVDSIFVSDAVISGGEHYEGTVTAHNLYGRPYDFSYNATVRSQGLVVLAEVSDYIEAVNCTYLSDDNDEDDPSILIKLVSDKEFKSSENLFPLGVLVVVESEVFGDCVLSSNLTSNITSANSTLELPPEYYAQDGYLYVKLVRTLDSRTVMLSGIRLGYTSMFEDHSVELLPPSPETRELRQLQANTNDTFCLNLPKLEIRDEGVPGADPKHRNHIFGTFEVTPLCFGMDFDSFYTKRSFGRDMDFGFSFGLTIDLGVSFEVGSTGERSLLSEDPLYATRDLPLPFSVQLPKFFPGPRFQIGFFWRLELQAQINAKGAVGVGGVGRLFLNKHYTLSYQNGLEDTSPVIDEEEGGVAPGLSGKFYPFKSASEVAGFFGISPVVKAVLGDDSKKIEFSLPTGLWLAATTKVSEPPDPFPPVPANKLPPLVFGEEDCAVPHDFEMKVEFGLKKIIIKWKFEVDLPLIEPIRLIKPDQVELTFDLAIDIFLWCLAIIMECADESETFTLCGCINEEEQVCCSDRQIYSSPSCPCALPGGDYCTDPLQGCCPGSGLTGGTCISETSCCTATEGTDCGDGSCARSGGNCGRCGDNCHGLPDIPDGDGKPTGPSPSTPTPSATTPSVPSTPSAPTIDVPSTPSAPIVSAPFAGTPTPPQAPSAPSPPTPPTSPTDDPWDDWGFPSDLEGGLSPGLKRASPALSLGDPHIMTYDGLEYTCAAAGEFVLSKSTSSAFEVQARFESLVSGFPTGTTGIAITNDGINVVQFSLSENGPIDFGGCGLDYYVNGVPQMSLTEDVGMDGVDIYPFPNQLYVVFQGLDFLIGLRVRTQLGACWLSVLVQMSNDFRGNEDFVGLFGSRNGDTTDDWKLPNGAIVSIPVTQEGLTFEPAYNFCSQSWCLTDNSTSLFTYSGGSDTFDQFYHCDAPYNSSLEEAVAQAPLEVMQVCAPNDLACMIDGLAFGPDGARLYQADRAVNPYIGCVENDDCKNEACGFLEYTATSRRACCPNNSSVSVYSPWTSSYYTYYCAQPAGASCGSYSYLCESGLCHEGICENPRPDGSSCENNLYYLCESNLCIKSECRNTTLDNGESCDFNNDCTTSRCGYESFSESAGLICCDSLLYVSYYDIPWLSNSASFCRSQPLGAPCARNELCLSGICYNGTCQAERLTIGKSCSEHNVCLNNACAYQNVSESAEKVCCPSNGTTYIQIPEVSWAVAGSYVCARSQPTGSACGPTYYDNVCMSGICIDGICQDERKKVDEPCVAANDCQNTACALPNFTESGEKVCCNGTIVYVNSYYIPWSYSSLRFCASQPLGAPCPLDSICSSGVCLDGICQTARLPINELCSSNNQCSNGACAYQNFSQTAETVCCSSNSIQFVSYYLIPWSSYNAYFCRSQPLGSACPADSLCASNICYYGICQAERLPVGSACSSGDVCSTSLCAYQNFSESAETVCCSSTTFIQSPNISWAVGGASVCRYSQPTGFPCGETNNNALCVSDICYENECQDTLKPVNASCEENNDCQDRKCAKSNFTETAQDICCEGSIVNAYAYQIPWSNYNDGFCASQRLGAPCHSDNLCASGICYDGICQAERLAVGKPCSETGACLNYKCHFQNFSESAETVCCPSNAAVYIRSSEVSWAVNGAYVCSQSQPTGSSCGGSTGYDNLCMSGICYNGYCQETLQQAGEVCEAWNDCEGSVCANSNYSISAESICCEGSSVYVGYTPFFNNRNVCGDQPLGAPCPNGYYGDQLCATTICYEGLCQSARRGPGELCSDDIACEGGACGREDFVETSNSVCCPSNSSVFISQSYIPWSNQNLKFCDGQVVGAPCGPSQNNYLCASGICYNGYCQSELLD